MIRTLILFSVAMTLLCIGGLLLLPRPQIALHAESGTVAGAISETAETARDVIRAVTKTAPPSETIANRPEPTFTLSISTPRMHIDTGVYEGTTAPALSWGAGHHTQTPVPNPNHGNTVITGHSYYPGSAPGYRTFRYLHKLRIGDEIHIRHNNTTYVYRVSQRFTVAPDDTKILAQTDTPQLTLYTCTPVFTALRRLVYVAPLLRVQQG